MSLVSTSVKETLTSRVCPALCGSEFDRITVSIPFVLSLSLYLSLSTCVCVCIQGADEQHDLTLDFLEAVFGIEN